MGAGLLRSVHGTSGVLYVWLWFTSVQGTSGVLHIWLWCTYSNTAFLSVMFGSFIPCVPFLVVIVHFALPVRGDGGRGNFQDEGEIDFDTGLHAARAVRGINDGQVGVVVVVVVVVCSVTPPYVNPSLPAVCCSNRCCFDTMRICINTQPYRRSLQNLSHTT